ncbi:MAG TPA: O-antigen ligase family protein [Gaiellaceae bacterium]|nr:O-antigen ligase family protein [Gaiellaceae bacterium]
MLASLRKTAPARLRPDALVAVTVALALAVGSGVALGGPVVGLVSLLGLAGILLAARPRLVLLVYAGAVVLFEDDDLGFLPQRGVLYDGVPAPVDLLLVLLVLSTGLHALARRREVVTPAPFTLPLGLLALALLGAAVLGLFSGADPVDVANSLRGFVPLFLLTLVVVNLLDEQRLVVRAVGVAAALAAVKGLEGIAAWATGQGRPLGGSTITFYEPAANFLVLLLLLGGVSALLLRVALPWWVVAALPPALFAFVFSYRRNFWIAGLLALVLVVLISRLTEGRRALLPTAVLVTVATVTAVALRGPPELETTVAQRIQSLTPTRIASDPYDRYRLDEQANVFAEIRAHPITGIGLGVPWELRHPLPVELEGGRLYTHVVALWYWLKLGLAGLVAYLWLVVAALVVAFGILRRARHDVVRAAALASFAAIAGMAVAETTGSFTGVSDRYTVHVAALLGWLAAARRTHVADTS